MSSLTSVKTVGAMKKPLSPTCRLGVIHAGERKEGRHTRERQRKREREYALSAALESRALFLSGLHVREDFLELLLVHLPGSGK